MWQGQTDTISGVIIPRINIDVHNNILINIRVN